MKFRLAAAVLLALTAMPAAAKEKPFVLTPGMVFYAPDGTVAGTIRDVSGSAVVVDTGSHIVTLGAESFVPAKIGPTIGYTKAQLDAAVVQMLADQEARLNAAIAVGAELRSSEGLAVGTIRRINPDGSVMIGDGERAYRLERSQLSTDSAGLILRFSNAQLEAALKANGG
jgi:hypothetical protein